jgi:hypothetical protein
MKRKYSRPTLSRIKLDTDMLMVMASFGPGSDPEASLLKGLNPLKWLK